MSVEHTHTHDIDSYFAHSDSVGLSVNGDSNVLILGIGIIILLVICFLGRNRCKVEPRTSWADAKMTREEYIAPNEYGRKERNFY